jgi:hypothetical protein
MPRAVSGEHHYLFAFGKHSREEKLKEESVDREGDGR